MTFFFIGLEYNFNCCKAISTYIYNWYRDFSQLRICRPPPLFRRGHIYMKYAYSTELNEKSYLRFFRFLFLELWSILYSKFIEKWPILSTKPTLSEKPKIVKFIFHSFQHKPHFHSNLATFEKKMFERFHPFGYKKKLWWVSPPSTPTGAAPLDPACLLVEDPNITG